MFVMVTIHHSNFSEPSAKPSCGKNGQNREHPARLLTQWRRALFLKISNSQESLWSQLQPPNHLAHNLKVAGSNPAPATNHFG